MASNRGLGLFALLTAVATLFLLCAGGLVTSHGAGLAVPDWPNTYGYNLFFFPISQWVGGIFYEHTHWLAGAVVGLLTAILAVWLWMAERRSWLRWLGAAAFVGVVVQGVLGGLRVVLLKDELGIVHATLAQLFFSLVCAIALFAGPWWQRIKPVRVPRAPTRLLRWLFSTATVFILFQLVLGATMRHQHAGLAIPDFPLAYGKIWPAMDSVSMRSYNRDRMEVDAVNPITAFQVGLQMAHRVGALAVLAAVTICAVYVRRSLTGDHLLTRASLFWLGLVVLQAFLGAATIWTGKSADIATAHVAVGALVLMTGVLLNAGIARAVVAVPGAVGRVDSGSRGSRHLERLAPQAAPVGGTNA